ncbi:MAG: RNA polymerase factor sigma-54 [Peptoniphilaceae bacterium]
MLKLELNLSQKLNITNEMVTAIEIMELNSLELEDFIIKESEENILIEYDNKFDDDKFIKYIKDLKSLNKTYYYNNDHEDLDISSYVPKKVFLREFLLNQLGSMKIDKKKYKICKYIIENIDDSGYFRINISQAARDLGVEDEEVLSCLKIIWTFEPGGVGARDLKECLLLQIEGNDEILQKIIKYHLEDLSKNKLVKVAEEMKINRSELINYLEKIKRLNPKPASGYSTGEKNVEYIRPEIFIKVENEEISIEIEDKTSNFHINNYYLKLLETDIDEETKKYIKSKLSRTFFIIEAIEKRRETIRKVVEEILRIQREFFIYDKPLKALSLKDVASSLSISESTVSRVTKNKYLESKKGSYSLKSFFVSSINSEFGEISKDQVIERMKAIISEENKNKPLSDQKITDILREEGIDIKRRTVAKYRDDSDIPSASLRRSYYEQK